jgi:succinate dehydrogenase hydrophobic anchor subunit
MHINKSFHSIHNARIIYCHSMNKFFFACTVIHMHVHTKNGYRVVGKEVKLG